MGILFLPILILIMYFMLIRPQQKRAKEQRQLLEAIDVGDDVVTTAGIYGRIAELDGGTLFLKVSDNVEIKITKESIAGLVNYDEGDADDDVDLDLVEDTVDEDTVGEGIVEDELVDEDVVDE